MSDRIATYRCKICGAEWRFNPGDKILPYGSWSLVSEKAGDCCDNVAMGDQIELIADTASPNPLERGTHEPARPIKTFAVPAIVKAQADQRASIFEQIDLELIIGELTDTTKPWYKSKVILSLIAGLIMLGLQKLEWLPAWVTQDNLVSFLLVAIPMTAGIVARFGATDRVVAKQPPTIEGSHHVNS